MGPIIIAQQQGEFSSLQRNKRPTYYDAIGYDLRLLALHYSRRFYVLVKRALYRLLLWVLIDCLQFTAVAGKPIKAPQRREMTKYDELPCRDLKEDHSRAQRVRFQRFSAWQTVDLKARQYHKLIITSKEQYFFNLVSSDSDNPQRLRQAVNKLLHRKFLLPLSFSSLDILLLTALQTSRTKYPNFVSLSPAKLLLHALTVPSNSTSQTSSLSSFGPAAESDISNILLNCPNKQSDIDRFLPGSEGRLCASVLTPTITNIVNLSLTSGQLHAILKKSVVSP